MHIWWSAWYSGLPRTFWSLRNIETVEAITGIAIVDLSHCLLPSFWRRWVSRKSDLFRVFLYFFEQSMLVSRQSEFLAAVCGRWLCESQRMGFCIYKSQMLKRTVMMSMGFRQWQTKYLIIYFLQIRSGFACDISWPVSFWTDSQQLVFVWQLLWTSISPQLNRSHCGPCSQSCIVCLPLFNRSASCVKHLRAIVEFSSKKQITIIYWD